MKQSDKQRVLRWMGIFSLPWVVLAVLLWLATRPVKPTPGTETVVEGTVADMGDASRPDSSAARDLFGRSRPCLTLEYGDGTAELFLEAQIGAKMPGEDIRDRRVRLTVAEERGCGTRVYTACELLPDP